MRILPFGDRALLLEVDNLDSVLALDAALQADPPPGVIDIVPAARTVLLRLDAGGHLDAVRNHVTQLAVRSRPPSTDATGPPVEIPTRYDGDDLAAVADTLGWSTTDLVAAHTRTVWTVAFCGFAPGFAYLAGPDPALATVPRRRSPRTRVPPGSVALAGGFSAVYPGASPGGWNLLGRTALAVFDVERDPPALLRPGRTVRFVDIGAGS